MLFTVVSLFFSAEMCLARGFHMRAHVLHGTTPWYVHLGFWFLIISLVLLLVTKILSVREKNKSVQ